DVMQQDEKLAKELSRKLASAGAEVLPLENGDEKDFKVKVTSGLHKADEVILLFSPLSLHSKKLFYDMGVASVLKKPITTILYGVETADLPAPVAETIYIKYSELSEYLSKLREKSSATKEDEPEKVIVDRMKNALRDERFTWRSIKTLAQAGGLLESEA